MSFWTKEQVLNLIEIYRKYECLWKVTCKEYSNKALKEQAYAELTQYVKTFDPQASVAPLAKWCHFALGALTATVLPILFDFFISF